MPALDPNALLSDAHRLLAQGDRKAAMVSFEDSAAAWEAVCSPYAALPLLQLGKLFAAKQEWPQALQAYKRAAAARSSDAEAHCGVGRSLFQIHGSSQEAEAALQTALALWRNENSRDAKHALRTLANLRWKRRLFNDALSTMREALTLEPEFPSAWHDLGTMYGELGDVAQAEQAYSEAARLWGKQCDPLQVLALRNLGTLLLADNKPVQALAKLRKALELEPHDAETIDAMAQALLADGKRTQALQQFECAVNLWREKGSSDIVQGLQNWAQALQDDEDHDASVAKLLQAVALVPDSAQAWYHLGNAQDLAGQPDEAVRSFERSLELDKTDPYPHHNRAYVLASIGRYREAWAGWADALSTYREAVPPDPRTCQELETAQYLAQVLANPMGDWPASEAMHRLVLEHQPSNAEALAGLCNVYLRWAESDQPSAAAATRLPVVARRANAAWSAMLGGQQEAVALLAQADFALDQGLLAQTQGLLEKLQTSNARLPKKTYELSLRQGRLASLQDRPDQAVASYRTALLACPGDLSLRASLAQALHKAKLADRAEVEYRRVLAAAPGNVEALSGLAQICTEQAEAGDIDKLPEAERLLMEALNLAASSRAGSRLLRGRDLAQLQYLLGYVRVRMHEAGQTDTPGYLLPAAERHFQECLENDPSNTRCSAALARIRRHRTRLKHDGAIATGGTLLLCLLSLVVFGLAQADFYMSTKLQPSRLGVGNYLFATFVSLLFLVVGLYLPRLLKLKVLGIELEKADVAPTNPQAGLGIKR